MSRTKKRARIHHHFMSSFFYKGILCSFSLKKYFVQLFSTCSLALLFFGEMDDFGAKVARKILVKLPPVL